MAPINPIPPNNPVPPSRGKIAERLLPGGTEPDPRFTLANERTFLAWIRTSLALLAGGIAIEAFTSGPLPGDSPKGHCRAAASARHAAERWRRGALDPGGAEHAQQDTTATAADRATPGRRRRPGGRRRPDLHSLALNPWPLPARLRVPTGTSDCSPNGTPWPGAAPCWRLRPSVPYSCADSPISVSRSSSRWPFPPPPLASSTPHAVEVVPLCTKPRIGHYLRILAPLSQMTDFAVRAGLRPFQGRHEVPASLPHQDGAGSACAVRTAKGRRTPFHVAGICH